MLIGWPFDSFECLLYYLTRFSKYCQSLNMDELVGLVDFMCGFMEALMINGCQKPCERVAKSGGRGVSE